MSRIVRQKSWIYYRNLSKSSLTSANRVASCSVVHWSYVISVVVAVSVPQSKAAAHPKTREAAEERAKEPRPRRRKSTP